MTNGATEKREAWMNEIWDTSSNDKSAFSLWLRDLDDEMRARGGPTDGMECVLQ